MKTRWLTIMLATVLLFAVGVTAETPPHYRNSTSATITIKAWSTPYPDGSPTPDVNRIAFSLDNWATSTTKEFTPAQTWEGVFPVTLKIGTNTVQLRVWNIDNLQSLPISQEVIVVNIPPEGSLTINGG